MRWNVRRDWRESGLVSNLFPVKIDNSRLIYRYELDVTRAAREGDLKDRAVPPVSPTRAWRMYAQSLRQLPNLPPVLRVGSNIFAAAPLPDDALTLHPKFFDVGWERCSLRLTDQGPLGVLTADDLKQVMNKMLPWALSFHARNDGNFAVVREVDGKMICTEDSLAVSGLRVFRGTTAAILQIAVNGGLIDGSDGNGDAMSRRDDGARRATPHMPVPTSRALSSLNPAMGVVPDTIRLLVTAVVRRFSYQGRDVSVFQVQDASSTAHLTIWDSAPDIDVQALTPGTQIDLTNAKVKAADPRFHRINDAPIELHVMPHSVIRKVIVDSGTQQPVSPPPGSLVAGNPTEDSHLVAPSFRDTTLALRLDTRCTVASEKSLFDEIKQHFGDVWPYDEEQKKRIARAVQGTPAILSTNLRHTIVRSVRFDYNSPEEAPMDPHLRKLASELHKTQPYAVVHDFSVVPLQVLHCCYDPKMRSWQQVTAPACSFFPQDRVQILSKFRAALADGLKQWGVSLNSEAYSSRNVTVMEKPEDKLPKKSFTPLHVKPALPHAAGASSSSVIERPKIISLCAIRGKHSTPEELQANEKTSVSLARHFATPHHAIVDGEVAALAHVRKSLCVSRGNGPASPSLSSTSGGEGETLRDPNCVAIFLSSDRDSRATRWLTSECMRRGILPYFMQGVTNEKRLRLLNVQTAQNIQVKFNTNPFPAALDLAREVPSLQGRNVLVIGVDTCHTNATTTGSCVGFLISPGRNACVPTFWQNEKRGHELEQVTRHFGVVVEEGRRKAPGEVLHEVVVFQDGNVYADLEEMERCIPAGARLSFLCLHKRTHIRFTFHDRTAHREGNVCKGSVVRALTPVATADAARGDHQHLEGSDGAATAVAATTPSFFMQCHECFTSTARTVQFVVHRQSDTLPLPDLQKLTFALAHVGSPQSTKLPLPTRAAHRLSAQIERLVEASPAFRNVKIPEPLRSRCWFL